MIDRTFGILSLFVNCFGAAVVEVLVVVLRVLGASEVVLRVFGTSEDDE